MMLNFAESGHPFFCATSALERGELRSKEKGKKSIHFNGGEENIELILRTIISANQLSICGAVCRLAQRKISKDSEVAGKLAANEDLESMEIPPTWSRRETCCKIFKLKFEQLLDDQKLSKTVLRRPFIDNFLKKDNSSLHLKKKDPMK